MPKRKNRLRGILKDLGLKQAQAAELCGIKQERFRKILGNRVEILGWELTNIARALDTPERQIYEQAESEVHTIQRAFTAEPGQTESAGPMWHAHLVADDEATAQWLRRGLLQQEFLSEGPDFAKVTLLRGRSLLGRAVEQLGTTIDDRQPGLVVANQLLSIRRKEHDDDRKLSRFQLDLSFCGEHELLSVYVQSSAIKVETQGTWRVATAGHNVLLSDQDRLRLPNETTLRVEFTQEQDA